MYSSMTMVEGVEKMAALAAYQIELRCMPWLSLTVI